MNYKTGTNGLIEQEARWVKRPHTSPLADVELATAAVNALEALTTIPLDTVRITASNHWLRLEGTVSQPHQRITLEELARSVPGVKGVTDCIAIAVSPAAGH